MLTTEVSTEVATGNSSVFNSRNCFIGSKKELLIRLTKSDGDKLSRFSI